MIQSVPAKITLGLLLVISASCQLIPSTGVPLTPTPLSEQDLAAVICQVDDLPGAGWSLDAAEARAPHLEAAGEIMVSAYRVLLGEHSVTYFSLDCELAVYEDEAAAKRAFGKVCGQDRPSQHYPTVGEAACAFSGGVGEAPNWLIFRRGAALVLIRGDTEVAGPAAAVDSRLR